MGNVQRIGQLMLEAGHIDADDIRKIERECAGSGMRFASAAVKLGLVSEQEVLRLLAVQHGVPAIDLTRCVLRRSVLQRIPKDVAEREEIIPLRLEQNNLLIAMATPSNMTVRDEISFVTGFSVLPYVALRKRLRETLQLAYRDNSDPVVGPGANADAGDDDGYLAIVTQAPIPMTDEISLEIEIDVEEGSEPAPSPTGAQVSSGDSQWDHYAGEDKPTVVVIDDEPEILRLVVTSLKSLDANIVSASRGLEGLHKIKEYRPDLVVVDAMLPEVHGFEIVRKLKESKRFASTPVLMISAIYRGWRIAEDIKATYKVDAFLEKPFRVAELRRQASSLLERSGNGSNNAGEMSARAREAYEKAVAAYKGGDFAGASSALKEAETLEPFSANIQFMLARTLEQTHEPLQAIYHYERAIELNPGLFAATKNLALLYQAKGFRNKAIEMWERSLRAAPDDAVKNQIKEHLVSIL